MAITSHGSWNMPIMWCALASTCGRYTSQAARPSTNPATAPTRPTTAPLARTTRRMFLSVAPTAPSIASERSRRWARTVKPPTETRPMRSIPTVIAAIAMVSGLSTFCCAASAVARLSTFRPSEPSRTPCASNSTVTWVGAVTWPGTTRANSSRRLCGFRTMPVTRRAVPPWCHTLPILRLNAEATPLVTAT